MITGHWCTANVFHVFQKKFPFYLSHMLLFQLCVLTDFSLKLSFFTVLCKEYEMFPICGELICFICCTVYLTALLYISLSAHSYDDVFDVCDRCSISKAELFRSFMQLLSEVPDSQRPSTLRF